MGFLATHFLSVLGHVLAHPTFQEHVKRAASFAAHEFAREAVSRARANVRFTAQRSAHRV